MPDTTKQETVKLDDVNRRILQELQNNARISNLELAQKVGLSPSACLQRSRKLEELGYILGYGAQLAIEKISIHVIAIAEIFLEKHTTEAFHCFEQGIMAIPHIISCQRVSGDFDYFAQIICTDIYEYHKLSERMLNSDLGIARINPHFVLEQLDGFDNYPLDIITWQE